MKNLLTVKILGTKYSISLQSDKENPKLKECVGCCEQYSKEIIIQSMEDVENDTLLVNNPIEFQKKVARHEIIHAFLGESGLRSSSEWAEIEEMVDWFAVQWHKISKVIKEAEDIMEQTKK